MNNRHFWRKGEICRVMTMDEIKNELRTKETGLGLWTSDTKYGEFYGEFILAFTPNEYEHMGRVAEVVRAEYDYYATIEFADGKRFEIPCMCLKVVRPSISGKCEVVEPTPIEIDDIVDLELNDFSDISDEFFVMGELNTFKIYDGNNIDEIEDVEDVEVEDDRKHLVCDAYAEVIKARVRVGEVLEELDKAIKVLEDLLKE